MLKLSKSVYHYRARKDDRATEDKVLELALERPQEGQDKIYARIRGEGLKWNYKRVRRVYLKLRLNKRIKLRKRVPARVQEALVRPELPNETWSMDFMHDSLHNGRKFRVLNILDDYNREALAIEAHLSIGSRLVTDILSEICRHRGTPASIRVDNGPEFIATALRDWAEQRQIRLQFIQPGKPCQNGFIERFNRSYRQGVLDAYVFENLHQVRVLSEEWMHDYNHRRPHEALDGKSPIQHRLAHPAVGACSHSGVQTPSPLPIFTEQELTLSQS